MLTSHLIRAEWSISPDMTDNRHEFDLLFIGHFAVDRNVVDGVAEVASGGGVYYGGIAAARLGARGRRHTAG